MTELERHAEDVSRRLDIHRKVRGPAKKAWRTADRRLALASLLSKAGPSGMHLKDAARMLGLTFRDAHALMCDMVELALLEVEVEPQSEGDTYLLRFNPKEDLNA